MSTGGPAELSGWHTKAGGGGMFGRPTRRFFRLRSGVLTWYVSESATTPQNAVKVAECQVSATSDGTKLKLQAPNKMYTLNIETPALCATWLDALRAHATVESLEALPPKSGGSTPRLGEQGLKLQKAVLSRAASSGMGKRVLLAHVS